MSWLIMLAAVNGADNRILLFRTDSQGAKRLTGATVGADEGFVVLSGKGRVGRVVLPAFGTDSLNCDQLFQLSSSVLLYS